MDRAVRSLSLRGRPCSSIQLSEWVMQRHSLSALHSRYVISRERIAGSLRFDFLSAKNNNTLVKRFHEKRGKLALAKKTIVFKKRKVTLPSQVEHSAD